MDLDEGSLPNSLRIQADDEWAINSLSWPDMLAAAILILQHNQNASTREISLFEAHANLQTMSQSLRQGNYQIDKSYLHKLSNVSALIQRMPSTVKHVNTWKLQARRRYCYLPRMWSNMLFRFIGFISILLSQKQLSHALRSATERAHYYKLENFKRSLTSSTPASLEQDWTSFPDT